MVLTLVADGSHKSYKVIENAHFAPDQQKKATPRRMRSRFEATSGKHSVTAVVFRDEHFLLTAGAVDG